jgi:hypothetical protein
VYHKTLTRRLKGQPSRRDILANSRRLTNLEEEVVTQYITDLQSRGFPPRLSTVEEMVNQLLCDREVGPVGKNWAQNFVQRNPQLRTRKTRKMDYQRLKCEDPVIIRD